MQRFLSLFVDMDDGARLRALVAGWGRPVVLLHEWAGDHTLWTPLADRLARRFRVYAWDARCHGGQAGKGGPATIERMADDLATMIRALSLDKPIIVGHSMGALTAWAYIERYGCAGIEKLCVLDQSPRLITDDDWSLGIYGRFSARDNRRLIATMWADFPGGVLQLVGNGKNARTREAYQRNSRGMQRLRERLAMFDPEPLITCWDSLTRADLRPVLSRITVPTLLIYGADSNYYGPETGAYVRDQIADARLLVYEHADHAPHLNRPEHFLHDFCAFAGADPNWEAAA